MSRNTVVWYNRILWAAGVGVLASATDLDFSRFPDKKVEATEIQISNPFSTQKED